MRVMLISLFVGTLGAMGCDGGGLSDENSFELPFTPDTLLVATTMEAYGGNLEVTLAPAGTMCGTRGERRAYDNQAMIRIALVSVGQAGELTLVDEPQIDASESALPAINGFTGFLVPASNSERDMSQAHAAAMRGTGSVRLDVVPNYDTGRTLGHYDLRFGDYTYRGSFDVSYCERNLSANVKLLAWDLMTWCQVGVDSPLQPGSLWSKTPRLNTLGRDLGRGLRAQGMTEAEGQCLLESVEQCKDNVTDWVSVFGDDEMVKHCRVALALNCLEYETEHLSECESKMFDAGLSAPAVQ